MNKDYYSVRELADALRWPIYKVRYRLRIGEIKCERIGGYCIVIPRKEFERVTTGVPVNG